ncbi:MAG: thiamine-phosphate kinase, partial [Leptothrix sp. (in: b-proteobacteria)]
PLGAVVDASRLPGHPLLARQALALQRRCQLSGGDDYELLFTAPRTQRDAVLAAAQQAQTAVQRIGHIDAAPGVRVRDDDGTRLDSSAWTGFDHFSN